VAVVLICVYHEFSSYARQARGVPMQLGKDIGKLHKKCNNPYISKINSEAYSSS